MWYTCALYEGSNHNGKLIFQRKIQFEQANAGINWHRVFTRFENKYRQFFKPGYLMVRDSRGYGVGLLYTGPSKYWYIKYKGQPIKVTRDGGFSIGEWDGWLCGIGDVTKFPQKRYALDNLEILRKHKTLQEQKKFKLVKVTIK